MDAQITLPDDLKATIEREAAARAMSIPDFVRMSLEQLMAQNRSNDPMFADIAVYRDDGPVDAASNHDKYLYGNGS